MKSLFSICYVIALALTMTNIACAPKDKRFQSKTFINKDKKTIADQKALAKKKARAREAQEYKINPSRIAESEIYILVKSLEVQSLGSDNTELDLNLVVNVIAESTDTRLEVIRVSLGNLKASDKNLEFDKEIKIDRNELNKAILQLSKLTNNTNIKLEFSLNKNFQSFDAFGTPTEDKAIATYLLESKEITNQTKDYKVVTTNKDDKEKMSLSLAVFSQGKYTINKGLLKEKGTLLCQVKLDDEDEASQELEISIDSLKISNIFKDDTSNSDTSTIKQNILASAHDGNRKIDDIITVDTLDRDSKTIVSLKQESCKLSITDESKSEIGVSIILVNNNEETQTINMFGCCIEKPKSRSAKTTDVIK